jgi:hypothetical protein
MGPAHPNVLDEKAFKESHEREAALRVAETMQAAFGPREPRDLNRAHTRAIQSKINRLKRKLHAMGIKDAEIERRLRELKNA